MSFDTMACRNSIATNYNSMNEHEDARAQTEVCDVIESLSITAAPESTGVTTFVQEACTAVSAVDEKYSVTPYQVQVDLQDVRDYFRRPVCLIAGTVPNTRTRFQSIVNSFSGFLGTWNSGLQRLTGVYGIRAKIVLTLQVAATPFHQGLVTLSAQYGGVGATIFYDRGRDSNTATNLPHVVLDLSSDTSVQLHMPFLFPAEYCSVRNLPDEPSYLQINLNNLVPVPSIVGMGNPTYQMYIHLEDIELFGATPQTVSTVTVNAGRKLSPVTEEFENDSFPFSSALHAAGKAISFVAKGVPSISSIGGPVAWALGKAAGVVRYFGYGKPAVQDPVMRVNRIDTVGEFNTDVATASLVIAATASNTTSINTFVGASDVDEMALKYVVSRWAQIYQFDYNSSASVGQLLYACPINMLALWFRVQSGAINGNRIIGRTGSATGNSVQPSHLMFAATSFKQWRGTVKFRFIFAKTKMHAGRVLVCYNPYTTTTTNTAAMSNPTSVLVPSYGVNGADPFGYSAIFDLKDGNVFEFKVPYVSPAPYSNLATTNGALAMYIVNPLIASSVVSSSISCVVQVAGDSDFELANPAGVMFNVHNAGTIAVNAGRVLSESPEVINQLTMGECITSVKQLISIPHVAYGNLAPASSFTVPPWYYQPTPSVLVPAGGRPPPYSFSYGGNWASCYVFCKGGTDFHAYSQNSTTLLSVAQIPSPGGYYPNTISPDNRSNASIPALITGQGVVHARLPGFFPTSRIYTSLINGITPTGGTWPANPYVSGGNITPYLGVQAIYNVGTDAGVAVDVTINRNASDDAQLAHYIGPPPIYLPGTAPAAGKYDLDGTPLSF